MRAIRDGSRCGFLHRVRKMSGSGDEEGAREGGEGDAGVAALQSLLESFGIETGRTDKTLQALVAGIGENFAEDVHAVAMFQAGAAAGACARWWKIFMCVLLCCAMVGAAAKRNRDWPIGPAAAAGIERYRVPLAPVFFLRDVNGRHLVSGNHFH